MKKIFFVILVLWSAVSYSQAPNYNNYNVRNHFWQFSTNGLNIPAGATPVKLTGQYARSGALFYDTTGVDTGLYVSHGAYWVKVGVGSFNTSLGTGYKFAVDGTNNVKTVRGGNAIRIDTFSTLNEIRLRWLGDLDTNTIINGKNLRSLTFDSLAALTVNLTTTTGTVRIKALNNPTGGITYNPNDNNGMFRLDGQSLTEVGFRFDGMDYGPLHNEINNTITPTIAGGGLAYAGAVTGYWAANTYGGTRVQMTVGVKGNPYADSTATLTGVNVRGINLQSGDLGFIRFSGGYTEASPEYGRFATTTGYLGLKTITPDSNLTVTEGIWGKRGVRFSGLQTAPGTKAVRIDSDGNLSIADTSTGGGSTPILNSILAATGSNTIDNGNNLQEWQWNTLSGLTGMKLTSTSTAATGNQQTMLYIALSGTNAASSQTTYGARIQNTHGGTGADNIGMLITASGGATNTSLEATGIINANTGLNLKGASSPLQVGGSAGTSGQVLTSAGAATSPTWTSTITGVRWTARVGSTTSSATPTINTDNVDIYKLTAQAADITSMTTNLSGTPVDGDILEIQITGTAARAITWGASFVSSTVTLPTTTVTTATLSVIFQYYTTSSYGNNKWVCVNYY